MAQPKDMSGSPLPSKIQTFAGPSNEPRVLGKVIIITGANSILGIGRAAAHLFAAQGAKALFITDYATTNLDAHVSELENLYPEVQLHQRGLDAADETAVSALVDEAVEKYGRLDVFFANAGVNGRMVAVDQGDAKEFMDIMRVNALSVYLAIKHGSRGMRVVSSAKTKPSGSIIATASAAGVRSNAGATDYSASKAAVISIMQTACYQLAGLNIRCNAICPGIIETGMTGPMYEIARKRGTEGKIGQLNPLRRGGVADEVARLALFLGSDEASYINGQAILVDGGLSAGHPYVRGKLA